MLTPTNKAVLCSFADKEVRYKRVEEHVLAWCTAKLYIPQKLSGAICIPLESPNGGGSFR
jgi:hypothetical protein